MNGRDAILASIRACKTSTVSAPDRYQVPRETGDFVSRFAELAARVNAQVQIVDRMSEVPAAVAEILRSKNLPACVHIPADAELNLLPWGSTLDVKREAPGPDDAAVAIAPYALAETGTLVYPARADSPAAWHFRPGLEIAIVRGVNVLGQMEDVFARIKATGPIPHTINFVTGPSRTGDIEQTLELGAHGPKALAVLILRE